MNDEYDPKALRDAIVKAERKALGADLIPDEEREAKRLYPGPTFPSEKYAFRQGVEWERARRVFPVTREDVMKVLAGSKFKDDAENPHSWRCESDLYSCECASSLAADLMELFSSVSPPAEDEDTCTHEEFYLGRCVACGEEDDREYDPDDEPRVKSAREMTGCQNRGWYHDGSEEAEAHAQGRAVRPCPHHDGSNR